VLADNSTAGHPALPRLASRDDLVRLHTRNLGGLAGAYNQALALIRRQHPQITHVVFLDEDSDPAVLPAFLADPEVARLLHDAGTAAVAPAYVERATGLRGRYIELGRFRLHYLPRVFTGLRTVAFVINSMSVWPLQALQRIGDFNQGLAIDHVDTEYCLRARQSGLALHVHGSHVFQHSIGERRRFKLLGREMQAGGHGPARRYLIGRNTAWLGRHYLFREPAFAFLCATRLAYEAVGIAIAEDRRLAKLWALVRGAGVGLLTWRMA
jgi:rhamnosyltransferase